MASDINRVVIIGRLTRDPEAKQTNGGTTFCRFSIASNHSQKDGDGYKDVPGFFDCVVWGKQAETLQKYVSKGQRILIEGRLSWSSWEKDGKKLSKVEIAVEAFNFIERKTDGERSSGHSPDGAFTDENIPF